MRRSNGVGVVKSHSRPRPPPACQSSRLTHIEMDPLTWETFDVNAYSRNVLSAREMRAALPLRPGAYVTPLAARGSARPLATAAFAVPSNGRYIVSSGFTFFGVTLTRTSAILATRPPAKQ